MNTALPAAVCTPWFINSRVSCQSCSQAEAQRGRLQDKHKWDPGGRLLPDYITKEDELWQGQYVRSYTHDEYFLLHVWKISCFSKSPSSTALLS